jgi:hypothetical protein
MWMITLQRLMRRSAPLRLVLGLVVASSTYSACLVAEDFSPGNFQGLVMGKATSTDALRLFGKPDNVSRDEQRGYNWVYYHDIGPVSGRVEMYEKIENQIIETVVVYPNTKLSVADAVKQFGPSFKLVRYNFDNCLGNATEAPIYESPDGPLLFLVSPGLGITIRVEKDVVQDVEYNSKPIGATKSQCTTNQPPQ